MRNLWARGRGATRLIALAGLVAALTLGGAAKLGTAATNGSLTTNITVLNDQGPTILGQPTPGGNIGYQLTISNNSTNTLNHLVFSDTNGPTGSIVFLNNPSNINCSGFGTTTLNCTVAQMATGASFVITVLFSTDPNGIPGTGTVTNTFSGTYAPQSNNTSNNRTDPTKSFSTVTTRNYAGGTANEQFFAQSLLLPTNSNGQGNLGVGGPQGQSASVVMPPGFVNSNNFVGTTLQNLIGTPGCTTCLAFQTNVNMPTAATFNNNGPFWTGSAGQPFQVKIRVPGGALPSTFKKPTGVWHKDDAAGAVPSKLQMCTFDAQGNPQPQLTAAGICIQTLSQVNPSKDVIVLGWALSNGSYWIG